MNFLEKIPILKIRMVRMVRSLADRTFQLCPKPRGVDAVLDGQALLAPLIHLLQRFRVVAVIGSKQDTAAQLGIRVTSVLCFSKLSLAECLANFWQTLEDSFSAVAKPICSQPNTR